MSKYLNRQSYFSGFNPWILVKSLTRLPAFLRDASQYQKMDPPSGFRITLSDAFPILTDATASAGLVGGHYFHQDLWAARKIFSRAPLNHVDIGSRIDGFVAHLLTFRQVTVIDIRALETNIKGLTFLADDATNLGQVKSDSIESLSSLHVAEHFGLGRYGDAVDPTACFKFMSSLQRVLSPNGRLYFSVPIGRERVEFNAHRVFAPRTILDCFSELELVSFSLIGDDGNLYEDEDPAHLGEMEFACGLFEFTKIVRHSTAVAVSPTPIDDRL